MHFPLSRRAKFLAVLFILAAGPALAQTTPGPEEHWQTAFFKRGFVGTLPAGGAGGADSTMRTRIPMFFAGSQVRVYVQSAFEVPTAASKITFVRGKGGEAGGSIEGAPTQLKFDGSPSVSLDPKAKSVASDPAEAPIVPGIWYLQQSYSSERFPYAYAADGYTYQAGDQHAAEKLKFSVKGGVWPGGVYRIDVLTKDPRTTVLCYGDSITQGFNSTPDTGRSYPELLAKLINRPTLNLGFSGDVITQSIPAPQTIRTLKGVDTVILLMGINDIFRKTITTPKEYVQIASSFISGVKASGKKIYIGTITPAGGVAQFDRKPEKETLRQEINTWIREKAKVDGVIDFDAALRDPANPTKLLPEYQSDWIHPNDAGYQKMAETAATVLQKP